MRQTITKIRGMTVNIIVEESHHHHEKGGLICYVASNYAQVHGSVERLLSARADCPAQRQR
ncbi:MAG: hypothetical protein ACOH2J_20450 [Allorhizobium sp.]